METFVDIISDIGAQISKIKRCRINQQTLNSILKKEYVALAKPHNWKMTNTY